MSTTDDSEATTRTVHRTVTMHDLTPKDSGGYLMSGDTTAEVQVVKDGIRIRAKGRYGEPWKFLTWAEAWISATQE